MDRREIYEMVRKRIFFYRGTIKAFKRRGQLPIPSDKDKSFLGIFKLFNSNLAIDDDDAQSVKNLDFFTTADIIMSVEDSERKDVIAFRTEICELKDASYGNDDSGYRFSWVDFIGDVEGYSPWDTLPIDFDEKITLIDLSHNDDKIIDDMREWLKSQRDNQAKKRLSDNDIKKIVDNQVIPCMDLLFWAELKEIDYTNAQLGDMLFPNADFDRAEKVRKATRKEAIKYLTTNAYSHIL